MKRLFLLVMLFSLLLSFPARADHVFYPEGTDYWNVKLLSDRDTFPKVQECWIMGADGQEHYFRNGQFQTNVLTVDNRYAGEDGTLVTRTSIDDYDMVTASRNARVLVVSKSGHRMELWRNKRRIYSFTVSSGKVTGYDKDRLGDCRTPLGEFYIDHKIPDSFAYLALNLSYPNIEDAVRGYRAGLISRDTCDQIIKANRDHGYPSGDTSLGGAIQIHGCRAFEGPDASRGCVEMLSQDMEVVYHCMEKGDKVIILP